MAEFAHTTVLLNEAVDALQVQESGRYVDATFGRGGHSRLILQRLGASGRLVALDRDPEAVAQARALAAQDARLEVVHAAFSQIGQWPSASFDGLLMDLGVSSPQLDDAQRGFSFRADGPLDMRMDPTRGVPLADWLAGASVKEMAEVIHDYGEERFAVAIAKAIDRRRQTRGAIGRTAELAALVADTVKTREPGKDPATRTFQAFRIFINAELEELQQALSAALRILKPGARLVVISFHSLEDRLVKRFIRAHSQETVDRRVPAAPARAMPLRAVLRCKASAQQVQANPRARSAVMRVAQRTEACA